jgi:hypothetical protein
MPGVRTSYSYSKWEFSTMFGDALPEGGTHGAYRGQAAGTTGWEAAEAAAWAIWDTPQSRDCSEVHLHKSNAVAVQPVGQLCCAGEQARKMHHRPRTGPRARQWQIGHASPQRIRGWDVYRHGPGLPLGPDAKQMLRGSGGEPPAPGQCFGWIPNGEVKWMTLSGGRGLLH